MRSTSARVKDPCGFLHGLDWIILGMNFVPLRRPMFIDFFQFMYMLLVAQSSSSTQKEGKQVVRSPFCCCNSTKKNKKEYKNGVWTKP